MSSDAPAVPSHAEARQRMGHGLEAELAALRRLDTALRLREIAFFVALGLAGLAVNAWGYGAGPGWVSVLARVAGTLVSAVAINAFILLLHEGMHGTLFAREGANRWASVALGATFGMSFTSYRVLHQRHHQFLGDPRDPDDYINYTRRRPLLWALHYVRLLVGAYLYILLIPVLAWRHGSAIDRRRIAVEYLLLVALYAALFATLPIGPLLALWLAPLAIAAQMTTVRGLTQHGIAEARDPYLASRTIQAHPVVAFCLLQENYHLEHHLFPEIPSYHLAEAHRLLWPRLPRAVTGRSYLGFLVRFFAATLKRDETPIGRTELLGWEV